MRERFRTNKKSEIDWRFLTCEVPRASRSIFIELCQGEKIRAQAGEIIKAVFR